MIGRLCLHKKWTFPLGVLNLEYDINILASDIIWKNVIHLKTALLLTTIVLVFSTMSDNCSVLMGIFMVNSLICCNILRRCEHVNVQYIIQRHLQFLQL